MGVSEAGGLFEAIAEEVVEGDMSEPDKQQIGDLAGGYQIDEGDEAGDQIAVAEVVDGGAEVVVFEVAEHGYIWSEQEEGKQPPVAVSQMVEPQAGDKGDGAFEALERDGAGHTLSVYLIGCLYERVSGFCYSMGGY
jgi:hypothetical protein